MVLAVDWRRYPYPSAYTTEKYLFHLHPPAVPDHSWIHGGTALGDAWAYGHATPVRVIKPVAVFVLVYQRVFFTYGPLLGLILAAGLGGLVRFRRQSGGAGLLPWASAVVLLVFPIAAADFDYRYLLPVLPFACLAAGFAFARPAPAGPARPAQAQPAQAQPARAVPAAEPAAAEPAPPAAEPAASPPR